MNIHNFHAERIDYPSSKPFPELLAAFERRCPLAEVAKLYRLADGQASRLLIEQTVKGMTGELEFLTFGKIDQGPLVSLLGKPKKITIYTFGNPVIVNMMYEVNPETSAYTPLRAAVYEDYFGVAHFTYDRPSTLFQQFLDERIMAVARSLDEKMESLAKSVVE